MYILLLFCIINKKLYYLLFSINFKLQLLLNEVKKKRLLRLFSINDYLKKNRNCKNNFKILLKVLYI